MTSVEPSSHARTGSRGEIGLERTPRTLLFVPGNRPERFAKAVASGADAVIIDLEDSVPPAERAGARLAVGSWLSESHAYVRVNPAGTRDFDLDLEMLSSAAGLVALVLPKAEAPEDIDAALRGVGTNVPVVALIESAAGLAAAASVAAHHAVALLAFGNLDFAADCGMTVESPMELELLPARAQLVCVCRAAGLPGPIDGVTPQVNDDDALGVDVRRAVRLGYAGKLCIHPRQVPLVVRAFAPSADQVSWAQRVLGAVSDGVAVVDGAMVDRPVLLRAREVMVRHERANQVGAEAAAHN
jgi:citrate lyase beta subunit